MAARVGAQKLSLLRRGWHEVPDLVCSLGIFAVGLALAGVVVYRDQMDVRYGGARRYQHRLQYTVIRDTNIEEKDKWKLNNIYN